MLWPLLVMAVSFTALFMALHLAGMRNEILRRRVRTLGLHRRAAGRRAGRGRNPGAGASAMSGLGQHGGYIVAAYALAALVIVAGAGPAGHGSTGGSRARRWTGLKHAASAADPTADPMTRYTSPRQTARTQTAAIDTLPDESAGRRRWPVIIPLAVFAVLAGLFLVQLFRGRSLQAALGADRQAGAGVRPARRWTGCAADGEPVPGLCRRRSSGRVTVVNVWASWCVPCRDEHPLLIELARDPTIRVVGINYKDQAENARRFLGSLGNPFAAVGVDTAGRAAIDWGVYGVPETLHHRA